MEQYEHCLNLLSEEGVKIDDLVDLVMLLQSQYKPGLTREECESALVRILNKREVQHCIMTGICLDRLTHNNALNDVYLQNAIVSDAGLYGIDEVLAYGICNLYGSIALTNFGYIDKVKPGIIAKLNNVDHAQACHTFLDDIVGAIVASAAASVAHN